MEKRLRKKIVLTTSILAWVIVGCIVIWSIKSLIKYSINEITNDAQVFEYINPVISRVGGYITEVRFHDYEYVHKGDTLIVIDNKEYVLDESQVKAELVRNQAMDQVILQKKETLHNEAEEAKEAVNAAKAQVWKDELEYQRYEELYNNHATTAQKLEDIKSALQISKAALAAAEKHYKVSISKIDDVSQERGVVKAESNKLSEIRKRKNIDVGYTVITAPYDGRMGKRKIEIGQMINIGDALAYLVNDENPKWIMANFKETQIKYIHINETVEVVADAYPDRKYLGKVLSISPATGSSFSLLPPDNATGNFIKIVQRIPVKIEILPHTEYSSHDLLSGMNVEVTIPHSQY